MLLTEDKKIAIYARKSRFAVKRTPDKTAGNCLILFFCGTIFPSFTREVKFIIY